MSTTAAVRSRSALVLDHLVAHPGLTVGELGRVLGIPGQLRDTLRRLEQKAQVVSVTRWDPDQGREVSRWRVAPPASSRRRVRGIRRLLLAASVSVTG